MQENTTPGNDRPNPFQLDLNKIKPANEATSVPSRSEPVMPQPPPQPEQPQQVVPQPPTEQSAPPVPQPIVPQPPAEQAPQFLPQVPTQVQTRDSRPVAVVNRETVMAEAESRAQQWLAFIIAIPVLVAILVITYWETLVDLSNTWMNNIDYHHGFFVAPFVVYFLWVRRDTFPTKHGAVDTTFGIIIGTALLLFWSIFRYYVMIRSMVTLDSWTILVWVWAVCLMFFGIRVFIWALPSLIFLAFMFPWPPTVEMLMRGQLQPLAAKLSVYILQVLGEPAIAQANIVLMSNNQQLDVAAACSGIRVLVSVIAAAYAAVLLMRRPWWQNLLLFCVVVPVALFVNALRIAMTGLLIKHASEQVENLGFAKPTPVVCDEISGMIMLVLTFMFFVIIVWWFGMVFRRVDVSTQQMRMRHSE